MHEDGPRPRARQDGLLVEMVGDELLLYDQESHTAHCLSPIAASVWRHCDGERDVTELAELTGASENVVGGAIHELGEKGLVDAEPPLLQSTAPGISRRQAIGRVARIGAAAATPFIVSATAATPAMASSGEAIDCKTENRCVEDKTAICCCCNDGEAVTATAGQQTCAMACNGHNGVFGETAEKRAF